MIEIKLSQGAKPGHGGVLPATKNTVEIAKIRGVKPFTTILSPPSHSAFSDAKGLVHKVTGVLYHNDLNVVSNHEFVEPETGRFFVG